MITYVKFEREDGQSIICPIAGGDRYVVTPDTQRNLAKSYFLYDASTDSFVTYNEGTVNKNCYEIEEVVQNGAPPHGLIITNIDGLGVDNIDIVTSDYAIKDGSYLNGTRWGNRNIVITFKLVDSTRTGNSHYNIENSRLNLYDIFLGKKKVRMYIKTDSTGKERYIDGYVENAKPDVFTDEEEIEVSLICNDPFFKVRQMICPPASGHINYLGNADTGCKVRLTITDASENPTVAGLSFDRAKIISILGPNVYANGGVIEVSSEMGKKHAYYYTSPNSGAPEGSIMNAAGIGPYDWQYLTPGSNTVDAYYGSSHVVPGTGWPEEDIYVDPDTEEMPTNYNMVVEYDQRYGGV